MSFNLFLDDERFPSDVTWVDLPTVDWTIVRTVEAFAEALNLRGRPDLVSFDNDLQQKLEGHHAARLLCEACIERSWKLPECFVHTKNTQGADLIVSHLESFQKVFPELA